MVVKVVSVVTKISCLVWFMMLSPLAHSQENTADEQSVRLLEERISLWYQRGRPDRVAGVVEQMLRVNPQSPVLLEAQASLALQENNQQRAREILATLEQVAPQHPSTIRLQQTVGLSQEQQSALGDARILSLAGRYEEAVSALDRAFPEPPIQADLAVEYWQIRTQAGEAEAALAGLTNLQQRYPNQRRIELAVIRTRLVLGEITPEDLRRVQALGRDSVVGIESLALWARAANSLQPERGDLDLLREFLAEYPDSNQVREVYERLGAEYEAQQALLDDPDYRKQLRGLQELENENPEAAEAWLREALATRRDDPELLGGLGYATMRQGRQREAIRWFRLAAAAAPDTTVWLELEQVATFWRDVDLFDEAMLAGEQAKLGALLRSLRANPEAEFQPDVMLLREARYASVLGNEQRAQELYAQLVAENPDSTPAAWALFATYRDADDPQAMTDFFLSLSDAQALEIAPEYQRWQANQRVIAADQAVAEGDLALEYQELEQAHNLNPTDPWLVARLVALDEQAGRIQLAEERFAKLLQMNASADSYFAYALFLARNDREEEALQALAEIPADEQTENTLDMQTRLELNQRVARFNEDWRRGFERDPGLFSEVEVGQVVTIVSTMADSATRDDQHLLEQISARLSELDTSEPDTAAAYAEGARFAEAVGATDQAYTWSLQAIRLQRGGVADDRELWRAAATDDWRVAGLQSRAQRMAENSEAVLYLAFDRSAKGGTPGISELQSDTLLIDLRVPFSERAGHWFVRVDPTWVDAGAADLDDNFWRNRFGTGLVCEADCPTGVQPVSKDFGVALGVGVEFEDWWADIGRSPIGFNRSTWVGGIGLRTTAGQFGLRWNAERRILSSTMLSFAGQKDPFSDYSWGAVTRNGLGVSASWDQGERFGWWGSLGAEYYTGDHVASNHRWYAYQGGYMRAYDSEPFAVTVGLNTLFWGFDKDLSQSTFGQGNYYSPEFYQSVSLPVTIFGRFSRWSYLLRGSIGYSDSTLAASEFFPTRPDIQQRALDISGETGIDPIFLEGTGGGKSHSLSAVIEYQINHHWYVGFSTSLIRSDTFVPDQGLIYLRYHFGGNNLPVRRPPQPPSRYVDR
ncbi:hypothetical protein CWE13_10635 [Aliidiomarina shirensis]|uniref:Cellulose synthase operon C C-terminal domain-containing protein n=1 Tax=Aliidiomarina shirensis TaxID=1048642 RepID=A0A432WQE8_9GAMM|nr:cellulose synthase subunit BcsC-related outer membrane protein [Aliidiomarina shirensis]RUO35990.1 hypothetical protein CWE13_10635 [Aliidiomarina shirensis]